MAACRWISTIKGATHQKVLIDYVSNDKKTKNPEFESTQQENTINYVVNPEKTRRRNKNEIALPDDIFILEETENINAAFLEKAFFIPGEDTSDEMEYFVTGFGCTKENAHQMMLLANQNARKKNSINFAYHAVQSFKESPEEMTPELAHEIGKRLVEELWAKDYIVLVATHLNTKHCHNHFVICATSPYTGKKFYKGDKERYRMMDKSDELCREYGLHVIDASEKEYLSAGEMKARARGEPIMKDQLKADIDKAVTLAYSWNDFVKIIERFGHRFKYTNKNITIIPKGRTRGRRLSEKLGHDYTYERICKRILNKTPQQEEYQRQDRSKPLPTIPRIKFKGKLEEAVPFAKTNIRIQYYRFAYRMTIVPNLASKKKRKRISPYLREEITKFRKYENQIKLLRHRNIRTMPQLREHKGQLEVEISSREHNRQLLRNKLRRLTIKCQDPKRKF